MKRSIKNRIAAALLLAASLGGHNYKTGAVDHVDSRKLKNNKQSTSLPLLAKIGIPVGLGTTFGLLIYGISEQLSTRSLGTKSQSQSQSNIDININKGIDEFINEKKNENAKNVHNQRKKKRKKYLNVITNF